MDFRQQVPKVIAVLQKISPYLATLFAMELFFRARKLERPRLEVEFWNKGEDFTFSSGCVGKKYGQGPAIWFVHGWEGRGSQFRRLVESCLQSGFSAVVWEGPAHGNNPGDKTNLVDFSGTLLSDARAMKAPIHALIGHSFGGASAGYACHKGFPTNKVVIIAAPSSIAGVFERFWNMVGLSVKARGIFLQKVETRLQTQLESVSLITFIDKLNCDILVIHDRDDREIPISDVEKLKGLSERLTVLMTQGLGHRRILESAKVIEAVLDFVKPKEKQVSP